MRGASILLAVGLVLGCTWVKPSDEASSVRIATASEVAGCKRLGKTTSSVADSVGPFARGERKVATELAILARNEAALMGGDTVAPESVVAHGRQVFGVYRCAGS